MDFPRAHFILVAAVFAVFCVSSQTAEAASADYNLVRSASMFAIGGVGVAGTISKEETAMQKMKTAANAAAEFRALLHEGTPAGRMYALLALRELGVPDYEAVAKPFRGSTMPVEWARGCMITTNPSSEVVDWIDGYEKTQSSRK